MNTTKKNPLSVCWVDSIRKTVGVLLGSLLLVQHPPPNHATPLATAHDNKKKKRNTKLHLHLAVVLF